MPCSTPATITVNVPAFVPKQPILPPAAPGLPYVEVGWVFPQNPSEFCYAMAAQIWGHQMPDATSYKLVVTKNGQQVYSYEIQAAEIPYQADQITGYWFLSPDNFFNSRNQCSEFASYTTGQIVVGPSDTLGFTVQACNANGCSSSPTVSVPNIGVGNYGTPPTGLPTTAPTGTTNLTVVNASIANLTLSFPPVTGADSYEIIDTDLGQDFYLAGVSGTDNPLKFSLAQSLLQSLGLSVGSTINLAIQANNLIGDGPVGTPTKVTLTS